MQRLVFTVSSQYRLSFYQKKLYYIDVSDSQPNETEMRTDIHSESKLVPNDYECVGFWDSRPDYPLSEYELKERDILRKLVLNNGSSVHGLGQCAHCGSYLRYNIVYNHVPTDTYIVVGKDCAEGRFSLTMNAWNKWKSKLDAKRKLSKEIGAFNSWLTEDPKNLEAVDFLASDDAHEIQVKNFGKWVYHFLSDIKSKGNVPLSEKQVNAVLKVRDTNAKWKAEMERRDAELNVVIEGDGIEVSGEIVKAKSVPTGFGSYRYPDYTTKITIKDDRNFMLHGTCPRQIIDEVVHSDVFDGRDLDKLVGTRVKFIANVTASKDRPTFGFYKRPRKPELLQATVTN